MTLTHITPDRVFVRAYNSMWIADDPLCRNAVQLDRFQKVFTCNYCGASYELVWPAEDMVYSIERLLLMRPIPYTRNWFPGETLHDLMRENGEHGVFSDPRIETFGAKPLIVDDEGIRIDMLPVTRQREFKAVGG